DQLIARADEVPGKNGEKLRAHIDDLKMSYKLVTIVRDVPLPFALEALEVKPSNPHALAPVLAKYELKTIATHLGISLETFSQPTRPSLVDAPTDDLFAFAEQQAHSVVEANNMEPSTIVSTTAKIVNPSPTLSSLDSIQTHPHAYTLVTTAEEREALAARLLNVPMVAFDTETTGLSPRHDRAVGCSFAIQGSEAWYVALPEDDDGQREALAPFLSLFSSKTIIKVGHHLRFDRAVLRRLGIEMEGPLHDTLLAYYLLDATVPHDLDHAAKVFLNYQTIPITHLIGKGKNALTMDVLTPAQMLDYAAEDADIAYRLHEALWPQLEEKGLLSLLETCEQPLATVLLDMESVGVKIDLEALQHYRRELEGEILKLEVAIRETTGAGINLASSKQLGEFLFGTLKLDEAAKRTPSGQYKTDEEQLLKIRDRHPIVDQILDWRACVKLKNTYVEKLPLHIDTLDGRIHTTFNQTFTDTGRLSSSNPNLQNIPIRTERGQRIRSAFVSRAPGWSILSADYSQVELRLMAAMSQDERMIQAFLEGQDIHAQTAANVYNIPLDQVTSQQRSHCKMVNFGIIYGISAFGLASRLRIQRREAQQLIDAYFANYPAVKAYMEQMIALAREKGYAETLFGRRRPIIDIHSRNGATRAAAERIAINMPIQGTAADIIKMAMVALHGKLKAQQLRTQITLQIHDELLFDVPDEEREIVIPLIQDTMENIYPLSVPLKVSLGWGPDWLSAH
ncbi:MAG: DNA polymerase I, partial [bacterium]|nr:DNA polymerase I [bacterium]